VATGRAKFILDGEEHDAPSGTYVFVPDTATHRHAVAEEPDTTVLSFGGPPVFKPSAWEWTFRASQLKKTDPGAARKLLDEGLEAWPNSPSVLYEIGCWEAVQGNRDEAIAALRRALEREPRLRQYLETDDDLLSLREDPRFEELISG
jgi:hypothetical protein